MVCRRHLQFTSLPACFFFLLLFPPIRFRWFNCCCTCHVFFQFDVDFPLRFLAHHIVYFSVIRMFFLSSLCFVVSCSFSFAIWICELPCWWFCSLLSSPRRRKAIEHGHQRKSRNFSPWTNIGRFPATISVDVSFYLCVRFEQHSFIRVTKDSFHWLMICLLFIIHLLPNGILKRHEDLHFPFRSFSFLCTLNAREHSSRQKWKRRPRQGENLIAMIRQRGEGEKRVELDLSCSSKRSSQSTVRWGRTTFERTRRVDRCRTRRRVDDRISPSMCPSLAPFFLQTRDHSLAGDWFFSHSSKQSCTNVETTDALLLFVFLLSVCSFRFLSPFSVTLFSFPSCCPT